MIEYFHDTLTDDEISALFLPYLSQMKDSFEAALESLIMLNSQVLGENGGANHLQVFVSLLRTGVLLKKPWFQIDLKGSQGWGDLSECYTEWMPLDFLSFYEAKTDKVGSMYQAEAEKELEKASLKMAEALLKYLQKKKYYFSECIILKHMGWPLHIGEYMIET